MKVKFKTLFINYVDGLVLDERLKKFITDEVFLNDNPEFYLYYPALFSQYFEVEEEKLELLCVAGYLYYQATIFLDKVIDDKNLDLLFPSMVCQDESVKILSSLYPLNSIFWTLWNQRKMDYQKAILLEKQINENPSFENYSKLAILKATFGNCAIDGMFLLDDKKSENVYKILLQTHDYFSIAYQLNDDVLDFVNDYKNKQFNWCIYNFDSKYFEEYSVEDCKKIFYIEGFAIKIFNQGIEALDKALNLLMEHKLTNSIWFNHISEMKIKFQNSIREIESYLFQLEVDVEKSDVLLKNNNLDNAIENSILYIKKSLINNQWCDFYNQGGISNIWSSSFVLSKIVGENNLKKQFENEIELASKFILSSKSSNNMWGYNSTWIDDADSTNFALISLYFLNNLNNFNYDNWISYFNSDYFSTYNEPDFLINALADKNIENVDGWCANHHCVSAVSLYFLAISDKFHTIKNKLLENFKQLNLENISAYWWSDNIYTLYYLFLSYQKLNLKNDIEQIQNFISQKVENGFYKDTYGISLFFTALALEILTFNKSYKELTSKIADYLINNQFEDGSWQESNSLSIPRPNEINPINENYEVQTFGIGVRSHEFNRLFTTASAIRSLYLWKNQN
jgi:hypothetical protein